MSASYSQGQNPNRSELLTLNDIQLYYEVYGQGEALLLLHGWTQSSQFWKEYINDLAQSFEVYAVDMRGHGKSSPLDGNFSIQKTADDIRALINHLQKEQVHAIGLSYGGLALLQMATEHSQLLKSMVLIGVSPQYNGADNKDLGKDFSYEMLPAAFIEALKSVHTQGEAQIKALFNPQLDYKIDIKESLLKTIDTPSLIINGDQDEILGLGGAIRLHSNLPNSRLWVVPGTGHVPIGGPNKAQFLILCKELFAEN